MEWGKPEDARLVWSKGYCCTLRGGQGNALAGAGKLGTCPAQAVIPLLEQPCPAVLARPSACSSSQMLPLADVLCYPPQTVLLEKAWTGIGPQCHAQRGCARCALVGLAYERHQAGAVVVAGWSIATAGCLVRRLLSEHAVAGSNLPPPPSLVPVCPAAKLSSAC